MARLERRPLLSYGYIGARARCSFRLRHRVGLRRHFDSGFGAAPLRLSGAGGARARWRSGSALCGVVGRGVSFVLGFTEETMLRGYAQFTITRGVGFWWGAIVLALLFGLMHRPNPGESPVGLASVVGAGLIFCLSLWYTGSLWWAVGFHAAWDWGQSYFYGTADSGMVAQGHLFREHPVGQRPVERRSDRSRRQRSGFAVSAGCRLLMAVWWGRRASRLSRQCAGRRGGRCPLAEARAPQAHCVFVIYKLQCQRDRDSPLCYPRGKRCGGSMAARSGYECAGEGRRAN